MFEKRDLCIVIAGILLTASSAVVEAQQCVNRPNIMICGSNSRTGSNLYSGVGPFTEVSGCTPDTDTQALLITRDGASYSGATLLAYLNAGGRIITEYSRSNDVYNAIYATAYADGTNFGNCQDNAMPAVKLNPSDPFWVANSGLTPTAAGNEACGFDLAGLVSGEGSNVTALGGTLGGATMLVRRVQGSGTLFLLEADWQDNQISYTDDSKALMGALISACGATPAPQSVAAVPVDNPLALIGLGSLIALLGAGYARRRAVKG